MKSTINHRRTRKKGTRKTFLNKDFDKHFFFLLRMNNIFKRTSSICDIMFLTIMFISVISLPIKCSNINSATEEVTDIKNNSIVKEINFSTYNESSIENEIDFDDGKNADITSKKHKKDPWKELKQITSVEYSWSEHINVGDEDSKNKDAMMMDHEVDLYDLLNEINEYYDYYANPSNIDNLMRVDLNGTKSKMSDMLSKIKLDEMINDMMVTTNSPISGEEIFDDIDITTIPTLFPEFKKNATEKDTTTSSLPPLLSSSNSLPLKASEEIDSTDFVNIESTSESVSPVSSTTQATSSESTSTTSSSTSSTPLQVRFIRSNF